MKKRFFFLTILTLFLTIFYPFKAFSFIKIVDLVFDGKSIDPTKLQETLTTIKTNKKQNRLNRNSTTKLPTKLSIIEPRHKNPKSIQFEIDTSEVLVKSSNDIQLPISNAGFLNAIQEALGLFQAVTIAEIKFAPLRLTSLQPNSEDGRNLITFRTAIPPEGVPASSAIFTLTNYARTKNVTFMNEQIMVMPGTILDTDVIFDPSNNPCLAYFTTVGDFEPGGDPLAAILEGGFDPIAANKSCKNMVGNADIIDFAVRGISMALGLESSAIVSSAISNVPTDMARYALTNDDQIALANLYPNTKILKSRGSVTGRVLLNKKPLIAAHIVFEDSMTGEPVVGILSDYLGNFRAKGILPGTYTVYVEPLDSAAKAVDFIQNVFSYSANTSFATFVSPKPIKITAGKNTNLKFDIKQTHANTLNLNPQIRALTESEYLASGINNSLLPIRIMPGETLTSVLFWGDNISTDFGTLSVSGPGITISNAVNTLVPISPFVECAECMDTADKPCNRDPRCAVTDELTKESDQIPGVQVDITCDLDAMIGQRSIIFTLDKLDPKNPSFGLRDQLTGGLLISQ